jgi:hypothetical protein
MELQGNDWQRVVLWYTKVKRGFLGLMRISEQAGKQVDQEGRDPRRREWSYLRRAEDQGGNILDIPAQRRRDKQAAKEFFRKLLKGLTYVARVTVADKLKSYGAAERETLPGVEHRQHRYLNNRAENSHQPTRERERRMQRFKSPGHAQRFLSAYGPIRQHFRPSRHRLSAPLSLRDVEEISELARDHDFIAGRLKRTRSEPFSLRIARVEIS